MSLPITGDNNNNNNNIGGDDDDSSRKRGHTNLLFKSDISIDDSNPTSTNRKSPSKERIRRPILPYNENYGNNRRKNPKRNSTSGDGSGDGNNNTNNNNSSNGDGDSKKGSDTVTTTNKELLMLADYNITPAHNNEEIVVTNTQQQPQPLAVLSSPYSSPLLTTSSEVREHQEQQITKEDRKMKDNERNLSCSSRKEEDSNSRNSNSNSNSHSIRYIGKRIAKIFEILQDDGIDTKQIYFGTIVGSSRSNSSSVSTADATLFFYMPSLICLLTCL